MDDLISRQAAISAICNACGKIDCDKMDKCEKLQLPPAQLAKVATDINVGDKDIISRKAAIDALNHECCCGAVIDHCGLETAMDIISELPPTQTERITSRWIPCGERTPENDNDVLVQMNDGSMMVDYRAASSNGWFWAEFDDEPVAWMPLPEPMRLENK